MLAEARSTMCTLLLKAQGTPFDKNPEFKQLSRTKLGKKFGLQHIKGPSLNVQGVGGGGVACSQ